MLMTTPFRWPVMEMMYPPNRPKNNFTFDPLWGCFLSLSVKEEIEHCMHYYVMLIHIVHLHVQFFCADYRGTL